VLVALVSIPSKAFAHSVTHPNTIAYGSSSLKIPALAANARDVSRPSSCRGESPARAASGRGLLRFAEASQEMSRRARVL
jgi:hypothetical protein